MFCINRVTGSFLALESPDPLLFKVLGRPVRVRVVAYTFTSSSRYSAGSISRARPSFRLAGLDAARARWAADADSRWR